MNYLTFIKDVPRESWRGNRPSASYLCACGRIKVVRKRHVETDRIVTCGECDVNTTNKGWYGTPLYRRWANMISRCHGTGGSMHKDYGGRGIKVCERWRESFLNYLEDVGEPPFRGAELDRKDNSSDYEPGNVQWVTRTRNMRNVRNNVYYEFRGRRMLIPEAIELTGGRGVTSPHVRARLKRGWTLERAVTTDVISRP